MAIRLCRMRAEFSDSRDWLPAAGQVPAPSEIRPDRGRDRGLRRPPFKPGMCSEKQCLSVPRVINGLGIALQTDKVNRCCGSFATVNRAAKVVPEYIRRIVRMPDQFSHDLRPTDYDRRFRL